MRTLLGVILSLIVLPGVAAEAEIKFFANLLYTAPLGAEAPILDFNPRMFWTATAANVSDKPVTVTIFVCRADTGACQGFPQTLAPGASAQQESNTNDDLGGIFRYAKILHSGPAGAIRGALHLLVDEGGALMGLYTLEAH